MSGNRVRSPDWIKAPNHSTRTVRKPPKPETRGSNPRGPATFPVTSKAFWCAFVTFLFELKTFIFYELFLHGNCLRLTLFGHHNE